jgi:hypothetical protein
MKAWLLPFSLLLLVAGCQSASQPTNGLAGLRVRVVAEPKAGLPAARNVSVYDAGTPQGYGAFERVDYSSLDQIVIWVQPAMEASDGAVVPSATIHVDPRKPQSELSRVVFTRQKLIIQNDGPRPQVIYSVSDGNEFDLGSIPPGASGEFTVKSPGIIELLSDSMADPLARIYAAPTRWAALAKSGQTISFDDLPPGPASVHSLHPRLPGSQVNVSLIPNHIAQAEIKVGVNSLPKVAPSPVR